MGGLEVRDLVFLGRGPFSFVVASGECVGIAGPSGSGKSLLLRAIADLDPHEGEVLLDGVACRDIQGPDWRRMIGMLPAESGWWHDLVGEHFPGPLLAAARKLVVRLGFDEDVFTWQVQRLSTGERQRLAIIRLLVNNPQALLLDEPTASLDAENVLRAEELFSDYRRRHQVPVIWVSHDPEQLVRVANQIWRLDKGGALLTSK